MAIRVGARKAIGSTRRPGLSQQHMLAATTEGIDTVTIRVGINGFGRIGRNFWRAVHAAGAGGQARDIEIVAANDLGDITTFSQLLKYDTLLGTLDVGVSAGDGVITVGDAT